MRYHLTVLLFVFWTLSLFQGVYNVCISGNVTRLAALNNTGTTTDARISMSPDGTKVLIAQGFTGTWMIDITDPSTPSTFKAVINTGTQSRSAVMSSNNIVYIAADTSLEIYTVAGLTPVRLGGFPNTNLGRFNRVLLSPSETICYVGYNNGFLAVNVSIPSSPTFLGNLTMPDSVLDIRVVASGNIAYIANNNQGVVKLDISNPRNIVEIARLNGASVPALGGFLKYLDMSVDETFLVVGKGFLGIHFVDLGTFAAFPSSFTGVGTAVGVAISNDKKYVYVADSVSSNVTKLNIQNIFAPVVERRISTLGTTIAAVELSLDGTLGFFSFQSSFESHCVQNASVPVTTSLATTGVSTTQFAVTTGVATTSEVTTQFAVTTGVPVTTSLATTSLSGIETTAQTTQGGGVIGNNGSVKGSSNSLYIIIGAVVGGVILLACIILVIVLVTRKGKKDPESRSLQNQEFGRSNTTTTPQNQSLKGSLAFEESPGTQYDSLSESEKRDRSESRAERLLTSGGRRNTKDLIRFSDLANLVKIGEGSFGSVFRGEWVSRGLPIAVKQLHPHLVSDSHMDAFVREADLMRNLPPHPNVVLFLGITVPPDPICIVTEYLKMGSLHKFLHSSKEINTQRKVRLLVGIARGVLHLHNEEIIHRDLATRNVLLTNDLEPKVSDFGMSRVVEEKEQEGKTENPVGPLKWMAPESILHNTYSIKSDAFSFGVVCYEVMSRKDPFSEMTPVQVATRVVSHGLRVEMPDDTPEELQKVVSNCFLEDPASRPNFKQIYTELFNILNGIDEHTSFYDKKASEYESAEVEVGKRYSRSPNSIPSPGENADPSPYTGILEDSVRSPPQMNKQGKQEDYSSMPGEKK